MKTIVAGDAILKVNGVEIKCSGVSITYNEELKVERVDLVPKNWRQYVVCECTFEEVKDE